MGPRVSDAFSKAELFARLGYGGGYDLLDQALAEVGLSRPDKENISAEKENAVREALGHRFVIVCSRGDCQLQASEVTDGRTTVPAASQEECAVCGGSANARAVDEMVTAMRSAGMDRLCVVGGSPNTRVELERLVAGRIDLRLVDGAGTRTAQQAQADLAWANRVALWGGTILAHSVSNLYRGTHVIQFARRSIQELAREVARSTAAGEDRGLG